MAALSMTTKIYDMREKVLKVSDYLMLMYLRQAQE